MEEKEARKLLRKLFRIARSSRIGASHPRPDSEDFRQFLSAFQDVPDALRTVFPLFRFQSEGIAGRLLFIFIASTHKRHRGEIVGLLTDNLLSASLYVRGNSFRALQGITKKCPEIPFPSQVLIEALSAKDPKKIFYGLEGLYEAMNSGLGDLSPAISAIEKLLEHKDRGVRESAGKLLGGYWTLKKDNKKLLALMKHPSRRVGLSAMEGLYRHFPRKISEKKRFDYAGFTATVGEMLSSDDWESKEASAEALESSSWDADISKQITRLVAFIESEKHAPGGLPVKERPWPDEARSDAAHALLNSARKGTDVAKYLPDGAYKTANLVLRYADEEQIRKGKPQYKRLVERCKEIWDKWLGR
ncbi:MAG: hypothetical protein V1827_04585 [Candidatus Micrarchaeota archaeon]